MSLGSTIQELRKGKNWKQKTLAELTGMTQSYLSSIEGDKCDPKLSALESIAKVLNTNVPTLLLMVSLEKCTDPTETGILLNVATALESWDAFLQSQRQGQAASDNQA